MPPARIPRARAGQQTAALLAARRGVEGTAVRLVRRVRVARVLVVVPGQEEARVEEEARAQVVVVVQQEAQGEEEVLAQAA